MTWVWLSLSRRPWKSFAASGLAGDGNSLFTGLRPPLLPLQPILYPAAGGSFCSAASDHVLPKRLQWLSTALGITRVRCFICRALQLSLLHHFLPLSSLPAPASHMGLCSCFQNILSLFSPQYLLCASCSFCLGRSSPKLSMAGSLSPTTQLKHRFSEKPSAKLSSNPQSAFPSTSWLVTLSNTFSFGGLTYL